MDALRVVGEFEWTFNMQRNAKPTRPQPLQRKTQQASLFTRQIKLTEK